MLFVTSSLQKTIAYRIFIDFWKWFSTRKVLHYSKQDFMIDPVKVAKAKKSVELSLDWRFRGQQGTSSTAFLKSFLREIFCWPCHIVESWRCSHTRGFSMLPFIGFLPHKSLDFWHGRRFWQWEVKSCWNRVQVCIVFHVLPYPIWIKRVFCIQNKKGFVTRGRGANHLCFNSKQKKRVSVFKTKRVL